MTTTTAPTDVGNLTDYYLELHDTLEKRIQYLEEARNNDSATVSPDVQAAVEIWEEQYNLFTAKLDQLGGAELGDTSAADETLASNLTEIRQQIQDLTSNSQNLADLHKEQHSKLISRLHALGNQTQGDVAAVAEGLEHHIDMVIPILISLLSPWYSPFFKNKFRVLKLTGCAPTSRLS